MPFVISHGLGAGLAQPNPEPGWLQPPRAHARRDPSRGACRAAQSHTWSKRPAPAPLRHLLSPVRVHRQAHAHEPRLPTPDAHGAPGPLICQATASPAPAQDVARRILGEDVTQFATPPNWSSAWWARFTFNGITAYGNGAYSLIGGDELSDAERDQL